jgi:hypothetical protein
VRGSSHFLWLAAKKVTKESTGFGAVGRLEGGRGKPSDAPALSGNLLSCRFISTPLCAAAVTFFAAAKKVTKESSVTV